MGKLPERLPGNTRGRKLWPLRPPRLICRGALGACMAVNEPGSGAADNLTGVWNGVFQLPYYGSVEPLNTKPTLRPPIDSG